MRLLSNAAVLGCLCAATLKCVLLDGNLGFARRGQAQKIPMLGTNFGLDVLGIPGTNGQVHVWASPNILIQKCITAIKH